MRNVSLAMLALVAASLPLSAGAQGRPFPDHELYLTGPDNKMRVVSLPRVTRVADFTTNRERCSVALLTYGRVTMTCSPKEGGGQPAVWSGETHKFGDRCMFSPSYVVWTEEKALAPKIESAARELLAGPSCG